ncbi:MAG: nitric oxide reductase activation protein NorD [Hyphomicrobiaceae bacterium]
MSERIEVELWEPEESIGKIWHAFASGLDAPSVHANAAVSLDDVRGRIGVLFRGLGGARDVEIKPMRAPASRHRLSWRRSLGRAAEHLAQASFDGQSLRLPERIDFLDHTDKNIALYLWLAAACVNATPPRCEADPLRADIRSLQATTAMTRATLGACPGLRAVHTALRRETLALRRDRKLPRVEAALEAVIRQMLGGPPPTDAVAASIAAAVHGAAIDLGAFVAPRGYRTFEPVLMWPDLSAMQRGDRVDHDDEEPSGPKLADQHAQERAFRAKREKADQAARKDSLILHKYEAIFSWTEFLNLNRRVEDDDEDTAKKAADDLDEISLTKVPQRARARLKMHLDLSPADVEIEAIAGKHLYPEWDHRTKRHLPDYCRVLASQAEPAPEAPALLSCPIARRRIQEVRRQFEALRPRRVHLSRQIDGDELDFEAAVDARVDLAATGEHTDRVYRASRNQERDLAVSILMDASRSTESVVSGRQVIDIAREALIALAWGLEACGDDTEVNAFSSLRRDRVYVASCKRFDEPMTSLVESRISGLKPGFYTRLGAAVRHASAGLANHPRRRRLLLVITDGKPNDLDHYEGRHGVEDSHMAVREARRRGQSVFGVTIDAKSQSTFARIFGSGGFSVIPDPDKLTSALPQIYRHLVSE